MSKIIHGVIPTLPPYAPYIAEVMKHPAVAGARLNTVMPLKGEVGDELARLNSLMEGKPLWIDLKGRQLRTSYGHFYKGKTPEGRTYNLGGQIVKLEIDDPRATGDLVSPPWADITLDRRIKLDLSHGPILCLFRGGKEKAYIVEVVDGNRLIMLDGPRRVVGGGESINILDPSLEVEGYLTDLDVQYVKAASAIGIHTFMLSFAEQDSDIEEVLAIDPKAVITAKLESARGLAWAQKSKYVRKGQVRLMAARGDLYVQMGSRPDRIIEALEGMIDADENAIVASRILDSLQDGPPTCADIMDIHALLTMGYRSFMIGDEVCFHREKLLLACDMLKAMIARANKALK